MIRLGWSLAALGTTAIAFCERFTLIDRMNTVFKIYNGVWLLLAIALATMLLAARVAGGVGSLVAVWLPLQRRRWSICRSESPRDGSSPG